MSNYNLADFQFIAKCRNCGGTVHGMYFPPAAKIVSFQKNGKDEYIDYEVDSRSVQFYTGLKLKDYKLYTDDIVKLNDKLGVIHFGTYNEQTDEEPKWKQGIYVEFEDGQTVNILDILYSPDLHIVKAGERK